MRRILTRVTIVIVFGALVSGFLVLLIGPAPHWLALYDKSGQPAPTPEQIDVARGRLLQVAAALVALGVLWYTSRNFSIAQAHQRLSLDNYKLAERGQITDRFVKAVELLGSASIDVRIGAIYTLERIARDSTDDHPTVTEILCSFVTRRSCEPVEAVDGDTTLTEDSVPALDVQTALTVIARRDHTRDRAPISLIGATLVGVHLEDAHLEGTDLSFTDLRQAHLPGAELRGANFTKADLSGAYLHGAKISHANMRWVTMEHAWANRTDFRHTIFWGADLSHADLHEADLRKADLSEYKSTLVTPPGSTVSMTHLKGPYPPGWLVSEEALFPNVRLEQANLLRAQLEDANLRGVEGLTREQVNSAMNYTQQLLPDYLHNSFDEG